MSNTATSALSPQGLSKVWLDITRWASVRNLALLAFIGGAAFVLARHPFNNPESGDPAIYDYIAQSILRGQLPYRDVVDIKGPGAPYLSALAMLTGKLVGLQDVLAVRVSNLLMMGLLSSLTFLVAQVYLRSRAAAIIAFLILLMRDQFAGFMIEGTQPKLPMILFGLVTLFLIARDKPFWSGICSMLSCLCWQPGLMFTGVAFLIFSRYLTSWRDRRALKVLLGAAIPLVIVLSYFYARGALGDLWAWTITYNYTVFGPDAERGSANAFDHLWTMIRRTFERDTILVMIAFLGLLVFCIQRIREKLEHGWALNSPELFRDALLFPPLIYLGFSLINFQGGPDTIPFFPFIGIFAGWSFLQLDLLIASYATRRLGQQLSAVPWARAIAATAIIIFVVIRAVAYRAEGRTLQDQYAATRSLSELLAPQDQIYVHGSVVILVLMNKPNLNPYVFLDWGADDFAAARRSMTFADIVDEMEAQSPKLVAISRLRKVNHRAELERWVERHYEKLDQYNYDNVMIRRQDK